MGRTTKRRKPLKLQSAYNRYKDDNAHLERWFVQAATKHNLPIPRPQNPKYDLSPKQYLILSKELINRGVQPPKSCKIRLNSLIKLRTRCWEWDEKTKPRQARRNEGHLAFIGIMRRVRQISFNIPVEHDTADTCSEREGSISPYNSTPLDDDTTRDDSDGESEVSEDDLSNLPSPSFPSPIYQGSDSDDDVSIRGEASCVDSDEDLDGAETETAEENACVPNVSLPAWSDSPLVRQSPRSNLDRTIEDLHWVLMMGPKTMKGNFQIFRLMTARSSQQNGDDAIRIEPWKTTRTQRMVPCVQTREGKEMMPAFQAPHRLPAQCIVGHGILYPPSHDQQRKPKHLRGFGRHICR
ncbi:hypothetical protein DFH07DRAFT_60766 [Mycena maculata]|uniref:DUF6604 domain-containing protein n=1 Tax=Mycena maculata TaxID=230809 RepID=A0AAD7N092_9AGAR|nr:hypothetical protein DFH07DRAFT_60766 [Mycena maculata]